MDHEAALEILSAAKNPRSVSEIVSTIRRRNDAVVKAIIDMERIGLVEKRADRRGVGRPRVIVSVTPLGEEFLQRHAQIDRIGLKATPAALRRAAADAEYAARLRARGLDSFTLFLELNEHVRSAAGSR